MRRATIGAVVWLAALCPAVHGDGPAPSTEQRLRTLEKEFEDFKTAQAEATAEAKQPGTFRAFWNKGLNFETADKNFTLRIGGRLDWDFGIISQDEANRKAFGDIQDGSEFRRLRLESEGTIYTNTYFKAQVDFGGGAVALKDALIGFKGIPVLGSLQAGHFKEPFSLEELTSSRFDTFVEQSLPTSAFAPSRNVGVAFFNNYRERVTYALGAFRDTGDSGTVLADDGYAVTGRVTALPWYADEGKKMLHVGAALRHSQPVAAKVKYEARPEWHASSKKFVSTGDIKHVESTDHMGLEAALVCGPFSVQGEYFHAWVNRDDGAVSDADFNGWYVEGSWWLTGEHRKYDRKKGEFGRVSPNKNFDPKNGGWGAWQLAARYSEIDLNDSGASIAGGKEQDTTLGLNWHLNPNVRVQGNWVHAMTDEPDKGDADIFMVRFHVDF
jgi:phosphate-selective porin OprO/OprP